MMNAIFSGVACDRREDQVALVLAVVIVGDDDDLAAGEGVDGVAARGTETRVLLRPDRAALVTRSRWRRGSADWPRAAWRSSAAIISRGPAHSCAARQAFECSAAQIEGEAGGTACRPDRGRSPALMRLGRPRSCVGSFDKLSQSRRQPRRPARSGFALGDRHGGRDEASLAVRAPAAAAAADSSSNSRDRVPASRAPLGRSRAGFRTAGIIAGSRAGSRRSMRVEQHQQLQLAFGRRAGR